MADVWTALALLLAPVFAEYAKIRAKTSKAFNFIAGAGVLTLLAVSFGVFNGISGAESVATYGGLLFEFIAWIFVLVGALWAALDLTKAK